MTLGDVTLADSKTPTLLFETGLPVRYYLPQGDVRMNLLEPSDHTSVCCYKDRASYLQAPPPPPRTLRPRRPPGEPLEGPTSSASRLPGTAQVSSSSLIPVRARFDAQPIEAAITCWSTARGRIWHWGLPEKLTGTAVADLHHLARTNPQKGDIGKVSRLDQRPVGNCPGALSELGDTGEGLHGDPANVEQGGDVFLVEDVRRLGQTVGVTAHRAFVIVRQRGESTTTACIQKTHDAATGG